LLHLQQGKSQPDPTEFKRFIMLGLVEERPSGFAIAELGAGDHNLPFPATFFTRDRCTCAGYLTLDEQTRLRSWLIVLGGLMAASPPVTALPWYERRDYPALLKLFSDPDKLPATYDAWLERAEQVERQFKRAGFGVARIWIRPVPFAGWCKERNVSLDQRARLTFAN
jgi:hypothetical protein